MKILRETAQLMRSVIVLFGLSFLLFGAETSFAEATQNQQSESNQNYSAQDDEYISTLKAAIRSATQAPATISLLDQPMQRYDLNV